MIIPLDLQLIRQSLFQSPIILIIKIPFCVCPCLVVFFFCVLMTCGNRPNRSSSELASKDLHLIDRERPTFSVALASAHTTAFCTCKTQRKPTEKKQTEKDNKKIVFRRRSFCWRMLFIRLYLSCCHYPVPFEIF